MLEHAVIRGTFEHLFNAMHFQLAIVPGQPPPATQHLGAPFLWVMLEILNVQFGRVLSHRVRHELIISQH